MSSEASIKVEQPGLQDTTQPEIPFNYEEERKIMQSLVQEFEDECTRVSNRREARKHRVNVLELRNHPEHPILEDETVYADRTIDRNVRQQSSPFVQFITQSPTVLSFYDLQIPSLSFEEFALFTTDIFRMGNWILPWLKIIDAVQVHGGGWFELVYNAALPQQAEIEYVRRESLIIPVKAKDNINTCDRFAREYEITKRQFDTLAKRYKFNEGVVAEVKEYYKNRPEFIKIYKKFLRDPSNILYNAWETSLDLSSNTWLRDPQPHQMGIFNRVEGINPLTGLPSVEFVPEPVIESPVFFIPLYAEEDEALLSIQGRAALDLPAQEAITSVLTSTINAAYRAAGFYPLEESTTRGMANPLQNKAPAPFKHGYAVAGIRELFQPNWPSNIALSVIQAVAGRNSQDSGQIDFAAMSRQDTAKRATEINAALSQAQELSSVSMTLFSASIRPAFVTWLKIIKSAVEQGRIVAPEKFKPLFDRVGNPALNIAMSADTTVVRRAQRASRYVQNYALVAGTPFADPFYRTMLKELFPEEFPDWEQQVGETDQYKQSLSQALQLMQGTPANSVPPELRQQYEQFITLASQLLNVPAANITDSGAGATSPS